MCTQCDQAGAPTELHVHARVDPASHAVHLRSNLHRAGDAGRAVVAALAAHVGLSGDELVKAAPEGAGPDWRYPSLDALIERARRDWDRFGDDLVQAVVELYTDGRLYPLTPERELALRRLFEHHAAWLVVRFTGLEEPRALEARREGVIRPADEHQPSLVEAAYRLGRGLDMLHAAAHYSHPADRAAHVEAVLREAVRVPLTREDVQALRYAQRRAAVYMRAPAEDMIGGVRVTLNEEERILTAAEQQAVRRSTTRAIAERMTSSEFARVLRDNRTPRLTNDMDRVARTELRMAHAWGAYQTLKETARNLGQADPLVYKVTGNTPCVHCRRIWGEKGSTRYRLSEVEAWERAGGNFRKPAKDWGPTIGPVHPQCTCGPLLLYDADLHDGMIAAADEILNDWKAG